MGNGNFDHIIQQNNFTNLTLHSLRNQTTRIEEILSKSKQEKASGESSKALMIKPPPKPMNKPPFKRGATIPQPNMATTEEEKFDPIKEFAEDPTAYEIHYYNNAIFALKGSKEELKYPYLISLYTVN